MIQKDRLIQTFLDLVTIDSPSGEEKNMVEEVKKRLETLGATVQTDAYGNVVGKFTGVGEPFMLNAHLDTVEPGRGIKPVVDGDSIKTDGTTILGADPKAGVSAILEALTSLKEDGKKHKAIEVVFTLGEESGLLGAQNLDYTAVSAKTGITFDGEMSPTNVDISAPGYNKVDIEITGRSAHAGVEPEKGLSAIVVASDLILQLPHARLDEETTTNIGFIRGGSARNAVPESVTLQGEIRSRNKEKLETIKKQYEKAIDLIKQKYPDAKIQAKIEREFDPYEISDTNPLRKEVEKVFSEMRLKPVYIASGGGTDVNIFQTHGINALVMGTGSYDMHTKREYAKISDMLAAAQFCEKIVLA